MPSRIRRAEHLMSIEQTPPNLENDGIESNIERVSSDFDRIHTLWNPLACLSAN